MHMEEDDLYKLLVIRKIKPADQGLISRSFGMMTSESCSWYVPFTSFADELIFHTGWAHLAAHGL
jgi:hypothetical protein